MKTTTFVCVLAIAVLLASAVAQADWVNPQQQWGTGIDLATLDASYSSSPGVWGAVSYDDSGDNVVVAGQGFYDRLDQGSILGTPSIEGNLAWFIAFDLVVDSPIGIEGPSSSDFFTYLYAHGNQPLDLWIEMDNVNGFYYPTFNAGLRATYNELAGGGWTEVAPGSYMDITFRGGTPESPAWGVLAFVTTIQYASGYDYDADITSADFVRFRYSPVPEPATITSVGLGLAGLAALRTRRRKRS